MADSADIQSKLANLTTRQCQILYWVCHGKDYNGIAQLLSWSKDLVQKEMSEIYDMFELTHLSRNERRFALFNTVCPIHLNQVSNPETDCASRVIEIGEPKPNPETLALVKRDERDGLIPLGGPVTVATKESSMLDRDRAELPPPPPKQSLLPGIIIGMLATLLLVAVGFIAFLLAGGRAPTAASLPTVITVVVTQPPSQNQPVPQPTQPVQIITVVVTQAAAAPVPTATPPAPPSPTVDPSSRVYNVDERVPLSSNVYLVLTKELISDNYCVLSSIGGFGLVLSVINDSSMDFLVRFDAQKSFKLSDDAGTTYVISGIYSRYTGNLCAENSAATFAVRGGSSEDFYVFIKGTVSSKAKLLNFTVENFSGKGPFKFVRE